MLKEGKGIEPSDDCKTTASLANWLDLPIVKTFQIKKGAPKLIGADKIDRENQSKIK